MTKCPEPSVDISTALAQPRIRPRPSPRPGVPRLRPVRLCEALPPHNRLIRRWRAQQVRRALDLGEYDERTALDGALAKLAADLGLSLKS